LRRTFAAEATKERAALRGPKMVLCYCLCLSGAG